MAIHFHSNIWDVHVLYCVVAERISVRQLLRVVPSRYAYVRVGHAEECQLVTLRNVNFRHS